MVLGGIASSLLGIPRFTHDIDALVLMDINEIENFLAQAKRVGLVPRISDAMGFARRSKVVLLLHRTSKIPVDISIGMLPFEEKAVRHSQRIKMKNIILNFPTPEDLIIFKGVAHRPQDLIDIQGVLKAHPRIDKRYIRRWLKDFAHTLEMPEIYEDIEKLLKKGKAL